MLPNSAQLGFPRRVVALYLLFCLGAVLLLSCGGVVAVRSLLNSQTTGGALSRIGRLAAAIELDHLKTAGDHAQSLVDQAQNEGRLAYCGIVDSEGNFSVHTDRSLIGTVAIEHVGDQLNWGEIRGVRYYADSDQAINEYSAPLQHATESLGTLVFAVNEPDWKETFFELAQYAPLAIVAPGVLIALGGWWLSRTTSPLAEIETRLASIARAPHHDAPQVQPAKPLNLATVGWNRLVQHVEEISQRTDADPAIQLSQLASGGGGRSREAFESLSEGIAVTDSTGRIDFANRAIAVLLGSEEHVDGASIDDLLHSLCPEKAEELSTANRETEAVAELPVDSASGKRTLRLARTPLAGGSEEGHVWCVRDITQQKLAEASRDQFIDTATHELRTPLANIKAYAETLAMCDMTDVEEQKEFCNTINTEATRLARFVDDLLSISSLEVGSLGIDRQNVDISRLLEEAASKIKPLTRQRSIDLKVELSAKLGEAKLDKDKISGLVVNLLGNAAKYTPEGGSITLKAVRSEDEIAIAVTDTGVGIAEDEQAKVFDKFFRSGNPDVQDIVGTGLGLSLAREIAQLHRGELTLESVLGEGSTFTVTLPTS